MTALWPTGSTTQPGISDGYGPRSGIEGARAFHYGVDIPMELGADVPAAQAGTVIFSGRNGTLGVQVVVRTPLGIEFLYPHMEDGSEIALHSLVKRGQPVGRVGLTGLTTGPHVCFRIFEGSWRSDADARNPVAFMAALNASATAGGDISLIGDIMATGLVTRLVDGPNKGDVFYLDLKTCVHIGGSVGDVELDRAERLIGRGKAANQSQKEVDTFMSLFNIPAGTLRRGVKYFG